MLYDGACVKRRKVTVHRQRQRLTMSETQRYCKFKTSLSFITVKCFVNTST